MSTEVYTDGLVIVDGVKIPRCPTRRSKLIYGRLKPRFLLMVMSGLGRNGSGQSVPCGIRYINVHRRNKKTQKGLSTIGKIFYIADTHLGHENVIKFDNRPFSSVEEMDRVIIENWNKSVKHEDTVYILGDFCWGNEVRWVEILEQLNGKKILIRGNHDKKRLPLSKVTPFLKLYIEDVQDYMEISDNGRHVILCHYPIPFYKSDYSPSVYMLYGHLHNTLEEHFMQEIKELIKKEDSRGRSTNKRNFYNCWCGFYDYKPVTLDEIIERWGDST